MFAVAFAFTFAVDFFSLLSFYFTNGCITLLTSSRLLNFPLFFCLLINNEGNDIHVFDETSSSEGLNS
jgi:hypothetical protein